MEVTGQLGIVDTCEAHSNPENLLGYRNRAHACTRQLREKRLLASQWTRGDTSHSLTVPGGKGR